jgi:hypothetical protein
MTSSIGPAFRFDGHKFLDQKREQDQNKEWDVRRHFAVLPSTRPGARHGPMLTALILADGDERALWRTLNALVGAAVQGLVREVVVLADADDVAAAALANHGGCACAAPDTLDAVLSAARGDWVMALRAGAVPEEGWQEALELTLEAVSAGIGAAAPAAFHFRRSPLSPLPFFGRWFGREAPLALGLIASKPSLSSLGGDLAARSARLAPKHFPGLLRTAR